MNTIDGIIADQQLYSVTPGVTVLEVARFMAERRIGAVSVIEDEALVGIVSERDVVHHLGEGADPDHVTAKDIMTTDMIKVAPETSIAEVARVMVEAGVRHLPVLDVKRRIPRPARSRSAAG